MTTTCPFKECAKPIGPGSVCCKHHWIFGLSAEDRHEIHAAHDDCRFGKITEECRDKRVQRVIDAVQ